MSRPRMVVPGFLALMLLLVACQGDAGSPGGGGEDAAGEGTQGEAVEAPTDLSGSLFAFGFGYETGDEIAQVRIDRFRELYPDVDLTFSESGFEEQPFLSALASGEPPDLVNIPRNVIGTFIARNVLEPLDDCIAQEGIDTGVFYESALAQVTSEGSVYAIPEFLNSRVWMINNEAFEDAGVDPESLDLSDWDAIAEANEALTKVDGNRLNRIGIDPKLPEFLPLWSWANGAPMISEDGTESLLDDPGVAEALEYANSLHEPAGGRTQFLDFRDTWDFFGAENQYMTDQLGAMPMEQWYLNVLAESSPDVDLTVRPFETPEGEPITWSDGNSWAIPSGNENFDAACAFVRVMTEAETWIEAAEARAEQREQDDQPNLGVYTGNREADEAIFADIDLSDYPQFEEAVRVVLEVQEQSFGIPPSPAAAQFETAWTDAVNQVMTGDGDAAGALQQADQSAQDDIDAAAR